MKIYGILEFSEDMGPGSTPSVEIHLFATEEDRSVFVQKWRELKNNIHTPHPDDPNKFFGWGDWVYWIESFEKEGFDTIQKYLNETS